MQHHIPSSLLGLYIGTTFLLVFLYAARLPLRHSSSPSKPARIYSYVGRDYPQAWPLELETVHMSVEDSVHYSIDTPVGDAEWASILPPGGAVLHLGPSYRPYTLSLLHELRCLDIIRRNIVDFYADDSDEAKIAQPELTRHCMNYVRQMVLCRADMRLETVRAPTGHKRTVSEVTHTCRDFTKVMEEAERNYDQYVRAGNATVT